MPYIEVTHVHVEEVEVVHIMLLAHYVVGGGEERGEVILSSSARYEELLEWRGGQACILILLFRNNVRGFATFFVESNIFQSAIGIMTTGNSSPLEGVYKEC